MIQVLTSIFFLSGSFFSELWLPLELLCVAGGIVMLVVCLNRKYMNAEPIGAGYRILTFILWLLAVGLFLTGNFLL